MTTQIDHSKEPRSILKTRGNSFVFKAPKKSVKIDDTLVRRTYSGRRNLSDKGNRRKRMSKLFPQDTPDGTLLNIKFF